MLVPLCFGFSRKDADFVFGVAVTTEYDAETANDQKREQKIPTESGPVAKEFTIPGDKYGPKPFELHVHSLS